MGRIEQAGMSELEPTDSEQHSADAGDTVIERDSLRCQERKYEPSSMDALSAVLQAAVPTRHEFSSDEVFLRRLDVELSEQQAPGESLVAILPPLVLSVIGALIYSVGVVALGLVLVAHLGMMDAVSAWLGQVAEGAFQLPLEALSGQTLGRQTLGIAQDLLAYWRGVGPEIRAVTVSVALSSVLLGVLFTLSVMSAGWTLCWSSNARPQRNGGS